ncbi:MAG: restriction endonuclease subunit S [Treponema sp.]|nr:restriction endonuclease subunit S [Spirochaetales bacterium]MDY5812124.1 restriction endonuclease subunit S [Treponema sp.]
MKDSGIKWIGEIPEGWGVTKLKYVFKKNCTNLRVGPFGSALSGNDIKEEGNWIYNQRCVLDNNFSTNDSFIDDKKFNQLKAFAVNPGDILITTRGSIGKVAIVPDDAPKGILHPCIIKFVIDDNILNKKILKYLFNNTNVIQEQIKQKSNSTTIDVIYSYNLKEIVLPLPPLAEQQKIADFLDGKCSKIDALKKDIQSQLEILEQYKKSVITEAVTKGIARGVKMKDSGIEWIGKIPEHWKIQKGKYIYSRKEVRKAILLNYSCFLQHKNME